MLNNTTNQILDTVKRADDVLVRIATEAYANAARKLEECAKRLKDESRRNGPLVDLYEMDLDHAFACFELAADDLRETRDGYRHTYPHPAALAPHGSRYPVR